MLVVVWWWWCVRVCVCVCVCACVCVRARRDSEQIGGKYTIMSWRRSGKQRTCILLHPPLSLIDALGTHYSSVFANTRSIIMYSQYKKPCTTVHQRMLASHGGACSAPPPPRTKICMRASVGARGTFSKAQTPSITRGCAYARR